MTTQTEADRLADALQAEFPGYEVSDLAAAELRYLMSLNNDLMDEVARLNKALTWEQNRSGRIGTHGLGCHTWGPSHYECLLRVNQELLEALKPFAVYGRTGSKDVEVGAAIAAIAKAQP